MKFEFVKYWTVKSSPILRSQQISVRIRLFLLGSDYFRYG